MANYDDVCKFLRSQAKPFLIPMVLGVCSGEAVIQDDPSHYLRVAIAKNTVARCPGVDSVRVTSYEPLATQPRVDRLTMPA